MQVAVLLTPGVSADECEAFTLAFEALDGAEIVGVGERPGPVQGPGGGHHIDRSFAEVLTPDVVLVPGGLGCERAATDDQVLGWLRDVGPRCRFMAASSTGTVVVAAAGLLDGHEAATHWLASPLLESYGSATAPTRVAEVGNIITCEGQITAMHVALLVTLRIAGPVALADVRARLAARVDPVASSVRPTRRWLPDRRSPRPSTSARPRNRELDAPEVIELEPLRFDSASDLWRIG